MTRAGAAGHSEIRLLAQKFGNASNRSASNGESCLMVQYGQRDNPDQSAGFACDTTCDPEGYKQRIYVFSSSSV